jgi:hypothetical protein
LEELAVRKLTLASFAGAFLVAGLVLWTPTDGASTAFGADDADADAGAKAKKRAFKKGQKGGGTDGLFAKLDVNPKDDKISKDEFAKLPEVYSKGNGKAKGRVKAGGVEKLFTKLDANSDGAVDREEFKKLGGGIGKARKKKKGAE